MSAPTPARGLFGFSPLPRLLWATDFSDGFGGWTALVGNYERTLDSVLPGFADLRPPQLSNLGMWDTGSAGGLHGDYALKLQTRPRVGAMAAAVKRSTWQVRAPIQLEAWVAIKPEASALELSETDVRAFGIAFDLQDDERRVMPHVRYLNAEHGEQIGQWQVRTTAPATRDIGDSGKTRSIFHLDPSGWQAVADGRQLLCYNEIATKVNWHYLRVKVDLTGMRLLELQCNDRRWSGGTLDELRMAAMSNLWCMLNAVFWVEAGTARRALLFVDSLVLSQEQPEGSP